MFPAKIVQEAFGDFKEQIDLLENERLELPENERPDDILNERAIFFGQSQADLSGFSDAIQMELRLKDFSDLKDIQV